MTVTENRDTLYWHLVGFYQQYEYEKERNKELAVGDFAHKYLDNEIAMENGMREYHESLHKIYLYNQRILKAVKSIKGNTFYKHLIEFLKEREPVDYCQFEIIKNPIGKEQSVDECGRSIRKEWVTQYSVGDSGDSWEGTICVQLKQNKYLKFNFSI
jgi:hypothetical protein